MDHVDVLNNAGQTRPCRPFCPPRPQCPSRRSAGAQLAAAWTPGRTDVDLAFRDRQNGGQQLVEMLSLSR